MGLGRGASGGRGCATARARAVGGCVANRVVGIGGAESSWPRARDSPASQPALAWVITSRISFDLTPCDRPGCYEPFEVSKRSPLQRFCSAPCRRSMRVVRLREARWRERWKAVRLGRRCARSVTVRSRPSV